MHQEFPKRRSCRTLSKRSFIPSLIVFITIISVNAEEFKGVIIKNDNSENRIVLVGNEGSYLFNDSDTPEVTIYDRTNPDKGTYNITSFSNDFIIQDNQCQLRDFDRVNGDGIYLLAIGKFFDSPTLETAILMYPDSDNFCGEPIVIWLDHKILAEKLKIDASGNFYLLGLLVSDNPETVGQDFPGEQPLLHKFTPEGTLAYSSFVRTINPDQGRLSETSTSPILLHSDLAVSPNGEVWILWNNIDTEKTANNKSSLKANLFHANPEGKVTEVYPEPPESGYTLTGLIKNSDSSEVLFAWEDLLSKTETNTILTSPDGSVVMQGSYFGRIISVSENLVITKTNKMRVGFRKNALIMYSHD